MYCPHCGVQQAVRSRNCRSCGKPLPLPSDGYDAEELKHVLPFNTDPVAITAGYLGPCGFFFCGLPGPIAVALGGWGLQRLDRRPGARGHVRAWTGIVLGVLQTLFGLGMLYAMLSEP